VSEVVSSLRWDAESDLAPIVGDIAAVRIVQAARALAAQVKTGGQRLAENAAEYLLEENPMLLYRRAGEDFASDVAVLRDDVERLAKRIALLEKLGGAV
jgi:ubiquinone biosynthesis protein UbiJ